MPFIFSSKRLYLRYPKQLQRVFNIVKCNRFVARPTAPIKTNLSIAPTNFMGWPGKGHVTALALIPQQIGLNRY